MTTSGWPRSGAARSAPRARGQRRGALISTIVLLALSACSTGAAVPDSVAVDIGDVRVDANPNSVISAVLHFTTSAPTTGTVTLESGDGHVVEVPIDDQAADHTVPLVGMRAEKTYAIGIEVTSADGTHTDQHDAATFTTGALPTSLPPIEVLTSDPDRMAGGVTMMSLQSRGDGFPEDGATPEEYPTDAPKGNIVAIDDEGEIVWYFTAPLPIADVDVNAAGNIIATYNQQGALEIDLLGNVVRSWAGTTTDGRDDQGVPLAYPGSIPVATDTMHHEISQLPNGNLLTLSSELVDVPFDTNPCPADPNASTDATTTPAFDFQGTYPVVADTVVEFDPDTGEVVSERSLLDVIDVSTQPGEVFCDAVPFDWYPDAPNASDWTHANAAFIDTDRNELVVSIRHLSSVLAMRYQADDQGPAGEVVWQFGPTGDFTLAGEDAGTAEWQHFQHAPSLDGDDSYLLYDNGNLRPGTTPAGGDDPPYSRAVEFQLDHDTNTATQVWEDISLDDTGAPIYGDFVGDADRLDNGNVLIDHGGIIIADTDTSDTGDTVDVARIRAHLFEVAPTGSEGGDTVFEIVIQDPRTGWLAYRAERQATLYDLQPGG